MNQGMRLLVYPASDLDKAKMLFHALLGVDPYVDGPYYVGFRTADLEIGLDPRGTHQGPIAYWEVPDIRAALQTLLSAGAELAQDVKDVGRGMLIAQAKDAGGSMIGLRQSPR